MIKAAYKNKWSIAGIGLENIFCCPKATNIIVLKRSPVLPEKETFLPNSIFLLIFFTLI
jgi:hypothetical protein